MDADNLALGHDHRSSRLLAVQIYRASQHFSSSLHNVCLRAKEHLWRGEDGHIPTALQLLILLSLFPSKQASGKNVARWIGVRRNTAQQGFGELRKLGWVEELQCEQDGRSKLLKMTATGELLAHFAVNELMKLNGVSGADGKTTRANMRYLEKVMDGLAKREAELQESQKVRRKGDRKLARAEGD
jgi:DNA-binding MarR family transcriptional regulator